MITSISKVLVRQCQQIGHRLALLTSSTIAMPKNTPSRQQNSAIATASECNNHGLCFGLGISHWSNWVLLPFMAAVLAYASSALAQPAACGVERPIVFADLDWDSNAFNTEVARFILEHGFDCETDKLPGTTIPLLNGMAKGDIDITMEVWPENAAQALKQALESGQVIDVGVNFPDVVQAWYVPKYLIEGDDAPAKGLQSVADLPQYKDLFTDPEEPEKGRFYNCIAGWSCETYNSKKLIAYNLEDSFVNFRPGTGAALNAAIESHIKREKPIVFYYWGPSWLMGKLGDKIVALAEPAYDADIWHDFETSDKPSQTTAYPVVAVHIAANAEFATAAPEIIAFLRQYKMTSKKISDALLYMQDNDGSVEQAAQFFLSNNQALWSQWLPPAVAAKVAAAL